jgi:hypothetical protein
MGKWSLKGHIEGILMSRERASEIGKNTIHVLKKQRGHLTVTQPTVSALFLICFFHVLYFIMTYAEAIKK